MLCGAIPSHDPRLDFDVNENSWPERPLPPPFSRKSRRPRCSQYWQKDPDVYLRSATSAIFNLVHREFAPIADRLRSVIARERQIPRLLAAGNANIEHPPRAFVDIAIRNVAGSIDFLKTGATAAFAAVEDQELKREFTASNAAAIAAFENYKTDLEQELKPKADGDFTLGSDLFAKPGLWRDGRHSAEQTARYCLRAAA
jgi:hypothetical protein